MNTMFAQRQQRIKPDEPEALKPAARAVLQELADRVFEELALEWFELSKAKGDVHSRASKVDASEQGD